MFFTFCSVILPSFGARNNVVICFRVLASPAPPFFFIFISRGMGWYYGLTGDGASVGYCFNLPW